MKITLVAPPYPLEEAPSPPLGICYVAAVCEEAGAEVRIFDYIVRHYTPEKLKKELDSFNPDIIGSTSVTMNFPAAADIIRTAKRLNPSLITMMGGPHVSFDIDNTLNRYPEIDLIVVGESEITLKELIPVIKNKSSWTDIKGIAFRKDNGIFKTESRGLMKDIEKVTLPARHLLPMSRYHALGFPVSIITSRGCPNKCIFCLGRKMVGMKVRYRSPESVLDEIEHILSYGFTRINIADDFFTANKKRVRLICEEILKRNIDFTWSAFARVDSVDVPTLELMKKAGCDTVSFGIESGNQEMLKRVKKGITLEQARRAFKACNDVGMVAHASFMIGLPGETEQTLKDSTDFAEELGIDYSYHFLAPFPGTTIREEKENYDIEFLTDDWNRYDANKPIVNTSCLSAEDMESFAAFFEKEHEKNWENVKERYKKGECTDFETLLVEGYPRMGFIYKVLSSDLIEDNGFYKVNSSSDQVVELSKRVAEAADLEKGFVTKILKSLSESGYLKFNRNEDMIEWFWTHNNRMDVFRSTERR